MVKSKLHIILSAAISIDGKIATFTGDSKLSSKEDSIRLHKLRSKVDAILIGKNTVVRDDPLLTVRYSKGKNPIRIVLDSQGKISQKSKIIKTCKSIPTIIAVSKKITKKNFELLKKHPLDVVVCGQSSIDIKLLLKQLENQGITSLLVEGGGTVNWEFIKSGFFDEILVTVSPFLIGGTDAISFVQGRGFAKIEKSPNLKLKSIRRLKNHLVLHYIKV